MLCWTVVTPYLLKGQIKKKWVKFEAVKNGICFINRDKNSSEKCTLLGFYAAMFSNNSRRKLKITLRIFFHFSNRLHRVWGSPSLPDGHRSSFLLVNMSEHEVNHSPLVSAEVKGLVELPSYFFYLFCTVHREHFVSTGWYKFPFLSFTLLLTHIPAENEIWYRHNY